MRIGVVSDTHGRTELLRTVAPILSACDAVIHLGDGARDLDALHLKCEIIRVRGNNDYYSVLPDYTVKEFCGKKFFITHGSNYSVKYTYDRLADAAFEKDCNYALFGHTHTPEDIIVGGVRCINPGALLSLFGSTPSYMLMNITDSEFSANLLYPHTDLF